MTSCKPIAGKIEAETFKLKEEIRMNQFVDRNREKLTELCVRYRVRRLEVFGSAAGEEFDPAASSKT